MRAYTQSIKFWTAKGRYGCFSNFSYHSIVTPFSQVCHHQHEGHYKTSEHYYQAHKFIDKSYAVLIIDAPTPRLCADIGRLKSMPLRENWDHLKDSIMRDALKLKFDQHPDIKEILMSTVGYELIEDSPYDYYWGCGAKGTGKNMLGKLLMGLRDDYLQTAESRSR